MIARHPFPQTPIDFQHAVTLFQQGRLDQAKATCESIRKQDPQHFDAIYLLGILHSRLGQTTEALQCLEAASKVQPTNLAVLSDLGVIYAWLSRFADALAICNRALAMKPDHVDALVNRGNALMELKRSTEAVASYDQALALRPQLPDTLYNRGNALTDLNRPADALASYEKAICLRPDFAEAYSNKGILLNEIRQFDSGSDAIEMAIKLAPRTPRYFYHLTAGKQLTLGSPHLQAMEQLARHPHGLSPDDQTYLHFALGKCFADLGEHEQSFQHLLNGNALKRKQIAYDEMDAIGILERTGAAFTNDVMRGKEGLSDISFASFFIVGMPRSGSTLIEQILASHPRILGTGQTNEFSNAATRLFGGTKETDSPEALSRLTAEQLRQLGSRYADRVQATAQTKKLVIDKTLENFQFIGLIHMALPNARFIHITRDPIDTCFSCFSTLFGERHRLYTYDLAELGRYYRAYESLMAHWREVLPLGAMLDVQYEDVVDDIEGQTRRILDYCGVEWDQCCLDFHNTERPVRTASKAQVRQPLFRSSIGRWRAYEHHLGPLLEALGLPPPDEGTEERS